MGAILQLDEGLGTLGRIETLVALLGIADHGDVLSLILWHILLLLVFHANLQLHFRMCGGLNLDLDQDATPFDAVIFRPAQDGVRGELSAVIGNDHLRLAAPLDDSRELACDPLARDRGIEYRCQSFACYVIDDNAEAPTKGKLVVHEVDRPACVDLGLDQDRRACSHGRPPGAALANCQTFLVVEPVDAIDARRLALPPQQDEQPSIPSTGMASLPNEATTHERSLQSEGVEPVMQHSHSKSG